MDGNERRGQEVHFRRTDKSRNELIHRVVIQRHRRTHLLNFLVGNDQMALGVLSGFHQHQVPIPGEKSVIGYDDTY